MPRDRGYRELLKVRLANDSSEAGRGITTERWLDGQYEVPFPFGNVVDASPPSSFQTPYFTTRNSKLDLENPEKPPLRKAACQTLDSIPPCATIPARRLLASLTAIHTPDPQLSPVRLRERIRLCHSLTASWKTRRRNCLSRCHCCSSAAIRIQTLRTEQYLQHSSLSPLQRQYSTNPRPTAALWAPKLYLASSQTFLFAI